MRFAEGLAHPDSAAIDSNSNILSKFIRQGYARGNARIETCLPDQPLQCVTAGKIICVRR